MAKAALKTTQHGIPCTLGNEILCHSHQESPFAAASEQAKACRYRLVFE